MGFNSHKIYGPLGYAHLFANWEVEFTDTDFSKNDVKKCFWCYQSLHALRRIWTKLILTVNPSIMGSGRAIITLFLLDLVWIAISLFVLRKREFCFLWFSVYYPTLSSPFCQLGGGVHRHWLLSKNEVEKCFWCYQSLHALRRIWTKLVLTVKPSILGNGSYIYHYLIQFNLYVKFYKTPKRDILL